MTNNPIPPYVTEKAFRLILDLSESGGDHQTVADLLGGAMGDGPDIARVTFGCALLQFFIQVWPSVLAQLEDKGVTGDDVSLGIAEHLVAVASDYLRRDVEAS